MKKKLLFINGHLDTGGVEKALLDILTHLDYEKYEVDLLLTERLGDYADQLPSQVNILLRSIEGTYGSFPQVILQCLKKQDWFSFKMRLIFQIMKVFGQRWVRLAKNMLTDGMHYDCAVGFRTGICTQIAAFACNADRRVTWWHHGEINVEPQSYLEAASACDQVAVVSNACRKMLRDAFPGLEQKLVTIPNMMDVEAVRQKAKAFDPFPDKDVCHIVSVGRLVEEKHFENAIFAAHCLKDKGYVFQWHLVGDGVLRDKLKQQMEDAGVTDCFVFEGNQPNPYPYMNHADLFVHPSYVESFGIVVAEAMALGIPCVITKSAGPCEFIEDRVNGVLTEQSAESLTEKVMDMLNNRELYEAIRANTHCPTQFLAGQVMAEIEDMLEK